MGYLTGKLNKRTSQLLTDTEGGKYDFERGRGNTIFDVIYRPLLWNLKTEKVGRNGADIKQRLKFSKYNRFDVRGSGSVKLQLTLGYCSAGLNIWEVCRRTSEADPDLWIRICIIKVRSGSIWTDTNPDPGQICHDKKIKLVLQFWLFQQKYRKA